MEPTSVQPVALVVRMGVHRPDRGRQLDVPDPDRDPGGRTMNFDALDAHIPEGSIEDKWENHKFSMKLVAPQNRRRFEVIVVGSGLAGAAAAATLGEMGFNVRCFTFHDSPRRAHSIAAQGGINAAKNYKADGDSVQRLFYDTV